MTATKHDRRSQRTRHLLLGAFAALLREQPYDSITVQNILDRADVGRSTFYMHFADKDDLLAQSFQRGLDMLVQQLGGDLQAEQLLNTTAVFAHIQSHRVFYLAHVYGRGTEVILHKGADTY